MKELRKKLNNLILRYDLNDKLDFHDADDCSKELLGIMVYFVQFSIDFRKQHGVSLFSKKSYLDLSSGMQRLKELRLQWSYLNFIEHRSNDLSAKSLVQLAIGDKEFAQKKSSSASQRPNGKICKKKKKKIYNSYTNC